jgi:hypothetical protein
VAGGGRTEEVEVRKGGDDGEKVELEEEKEEEKEEEEEEEEEEEFFVYEDSDSLSDGAAAEVHGIEVHDVLREINLCDIVPKSSPLALGIGQENSPPPTIESSPAAPAPVDAAIPISREAVTPRTKTLIQSFGGWQGMLPEPPLTTQAVGTSPQPPDVAEALATKEQSCPDCRVLRDKLCKTVPKEIVSRAEIRMGQVNGQLEGLMKENRKLKEQEKVS